MSQGLRPLNRDRQGWLDISGAASRQGRCSDPTCLYVAVALISAENNRLGVTALSVEFTTPAYRDEAARSPCLDRGSRDRIGALLRAAYDEVARAPIPNEHIDLLLALRHMERERRRELGRNSSP